MFLLLLSVLIVFATRAGVSENRNKGDVNPTRTVRVWRNSDTLIELGWGGRTIASDTKLNSGSTDDGVLWYEVDDLSVPYRGQRRLLTIFFAGNAALESPMPFSVHCGNGCEIEWGPDKTRNLSRLKKRLSPIYLQVESEFISHISSSLEGGQ